MSFNSAGLSLDQAPPQNIPFRFFLTAPIFGMAGFILMLWLGPSVFISRYHPGLIAITHMLTLGVITMTMVGALFQLMPVLAGSIIYQQKFLAPVIHIGLCLGTIGLAFGFFLFQETWLKWVSLVFLWGSLGTFIFISLIALFKAKSQHSTVRYMRLSLVSLAVTIVLGTFLELGHLNFMELYRPALTDLHLTWGFMGWIFLLILGVSLQVIPMFQVTPRYPDWLTKRYAPVFFLSLCALLLAVFNSLAFGREEFFASLYSALTGFLLLLIFLFMVATLWLQKKRKRGKRDILYWYGRLAFLVWFLGICTYFIDQNNSLWVHNDRRMIVVGIFMFWGVMAYINGMIYKIVPFLIWFNLQAKQMDAMMKGLETPKVPLMHEIIRQKYMWWQLSLFFSGCVLLVGAQFFTEAFYLGVLLLLLSYILLTQHIFGAERKSAYHTENILA